MRAVTYNVQSFRGGVDAAAGILAAEQPDLVLVQECGPKRAVRGLARSLEMEAESSHRRFGRVRNAVLSRPPWRVVGVEVAVFKREGKTLPRGFLAVRLRRLGMTLTVVSAHLGLSPHEREAHARELTDWLAGRVFDAFGHAGRGPGETFPARVPTARIDYLFVSEDIRPLRVWVSAAPDVVTASDHRPVIAELELEGTKVNP